VSLARLQIPASPAAMITEVFVNMVCEGVCVTRVMFNPPLPPGTAVTVEIEGESRSMTATWDSSLECPPGGQKG
jgi:hypothetical protein